MMSFYAPEFESQLLTRGSHLLKTPEVACLFQQDTQYTVRADTTHHH